MSDSTSTNDRVDRAVRDLLDDFERQGGNLYRNQVGKLLEKRKLSPSECLLVYEKLRPFGIIVSQLQENAQPLDSAPQVPNEDVTTYAPDAYQDRDPIKVSQNELYYEFQQLTSRFDLKTRNDFLTQQQELVCIRQVQLYRRLLSELGEDAFERTSEFRSISNDGQTAQEKLIVSNIRFVIMVAKQFVGISSLSLRDLFQEGVAGMIRAIEKFDEAQYENRFHTYAVWWIRQSIMKAITDQGPMIRFPFNIVADMGRYRRAYKFLASSHPEVYPSVTEIADELGWDKEKAGFIRDLCSYEFSSVKLSSDGSEEEALVDHLVDQSDGPDATVSSQNEKEVIKQALSGLDTRARTIIESSFGLSEGEYESTLQELGVKFNLTRERVRQIREKALKKLRKILGPYFGDEALKEAIAAFKPVDNSIELLRKVRLRKAASTRIDKDLEAGESETQRGTNGTRE